MRVYSRGTDNRIDIIDCCDPKKGQKFFKKKWGISAANDDKLIPCWSNVLSPMGTLSGGLRCSVSTMGIMPNEH